MAMHPFGTVVLVPFPFTDQSAAKQRPAVIVSSSAYHRARRDLILMPITSQLRGSAFGDVLVQDWQAAQLLMPSAAKEATLWPISGSEAILPCRRTDQTTRQSLAPCLAATSAPKRRAAADVERVSRFGLHTPTTALISDGTKANPRQLRWLLRAR